jgi:hypothetical protein
MEVKKQMSFGVIDLGTFLGFFFFFFFRGWIGGLFSHSDFGFVSFTCDTNQWE